MLKTLSLFSFFLLILMMTSCGKNEVINPISEDDTTCASGKAVIGIYDGFYQNHCGCNESQGQRIYAPAKLTCTVSVNTVVFFHYFNTTLTSQIAANGYPTIVSSQIFNPKLEDSNPSFAIQMDSVGTYPFYNTYNPDMIGELVIQ